MGNGNTFIHPVYAYNTYIMHVCIIALHQVSFWCVHRNSMHIPLCTSWACVLMQIKYSCILHLELYVYVCFRCLFYLGMYWCCCCCGCCWCFSAYVFGTSIISCLHGCSPPYSDCIMPTFTTMAIAEPVLFNTLQVVKFRLSQTPYQFNRYTSNIRSLITVPYRQFSAFNLHFVHTIRCAIG